MDPSLIFGLDSQLFIASDTHHEEQHDHFHHDEIQTLTIVQSRSKAPPSLLEVEKVLEGVPKEDGVYRIKGFIRVETGSKSYSDKNPASDQVPPGPLDPREDQAHQEILILNWAFGRWDFTPYTGVGGLEDASLHVRLTVMGERGSTVKNAARKLAEALDSEVL